MNTNIAHAILSNAAQNQSLLNWDHDINPTSLADAAANVIDSIIRKDPYLHYHGYMGYQISGNHIAIWQLPHPWLQLHLPFEARQPELIMDIHGVGTDDVYDLGLTPLTASELGELAIQFTDLLH